MKAPSDASRWRERGDSQWADYGVNVGHAVYGGIHFHAPANPAARPGHRNATPHLAGKTWHTAARSALTGLAHACGRTVAALTYLRPEKAGKEEA